MTFFDDLKSQAEGSVQDLQGVARQQFTRQYWFRGLINMAVVGVVFILLVKGLKKYGPGPVKKVAGKVL